MLLSRSWASPIKLVVGLRPDLGPFERMSMKSSIWMTVYSELASSRIPLGATCRDESGNGKIPYRPTPYQDFPDRMPYFREKTKSGKNSGKFGEIGIEIGWGLFPTKLADPVFNSVFSRGIPELQQPTPAKPSHVTAQGPFARPPSTKP